MNIQSLSIVVPCGDYCMNNCRFCVSHMHHEDYGKTIISAKNIPQSYLDRMAFVREEGCNSLILTGTTEPQQNLPFIYELLRLNRTLPKPFYNISIQTTGANMTEKDITDLAEHGVTTLALSVSSFDNKEHWDIVQTPKMARKLSLAELIMAAKNVNMNVRLCLNMTSAFNDYTPENMFQIAQFNRADQVTFRKIYSDGENEKTDWVRAHEYPEEKFKAIGDYIRENGVAIARLPYGFIQYSVHGISTVIDDNCMSKNNIDEMKYAILRPNGKLYSRWDDTGSLIF